jgi:hypothetical protein
MVWQEVAYKKLRCRKVIRLTQLSNRSEWRRLQEQISNTRRQLDFKPSSSIVTENSIGLINSEARSNSAEYMVSLRKDTVPERNQVYSLNFQIWIQFAERPRGNFVSQLEFLANFPTALSRFKPVNRIPGARNEEFVPTLRRPELSFLLLSPFLSPLSFSSLLLTWLLFLNFAWLYSVNSALVLPLRDRYQSKRLELKLQCRIKTIKQLKPVSHKKH